MGSVLLRRILSAPLPAENIFQGGRGAARRGAPCAGIDERPVARIGSALRCGGVRPLCSRHVEAQAAGPLLRDVRLCVSGPTAGVRILCRCARRLVSGIRDRERHHRVLGVAIVALRRSPGIAAKAAADPTRPG